MVKKFELNDDYIKLVHSCVKYFDFYPHKEELVQVGLIGLFKAYQKYDSSLNVKFTTYAYPYILGEMKKQIREDKSLKVSRDITSIHYKIEKVKILLSQKLMREPSINEIASYLEVPETLVIDSINTTKKIYSLEEPISIGSDSEVSMHETVKNFSNLSLDELLALKEALLSLEPQERKLVEMRYFYDYTQSEVAKALNMSQVQVSRSESKVKIKLKDKLAC